MTALLYCEKRDGLLCGFVVFCLGFEVEHLGVGFSDYVFYGFFCGYGGVEGEGVGFFVGDL